MNKILSTPSPTARWLVIGVLAILCTAALFYANPPIPGRAFRTNFVAPQTNLAATDHAATPDDLLW